MGQGLGDPCLNQSQASKRWKSNPRKGTNGARENICKEAMGGCQGRLCGPERDPGRGILLDFDSSRQWPALMVFSGPYRCARRETLRSFRDPSLHIRSRSKKGVEELCANAACLAWVIWKRLENEYKKPQKGDLTTKLENIAAQPL